MERHSKRILITGATGFIGSHLVRALTKQGHSVVVCVRPNERTLRYPPGITTFGVDFTKDLSVQDWLHRLKGIDVVINTVGIVRQTKSQSFDALHADSPIALFKACEVRGIARVIQVSALGSNEHSVSQFHRSKFQADRYLRSTRLDWAVVMPSIVYGPGAKSMSLFTAMAALPVVPLIDSGKQVIQPIHIDDLTRAIIDLVDSQSPLQADIEMVGPEPVSIRCLYQQLRAWLGLPAGRTLSIPYGLALYAAKLTGPLGDSPFTAATVEMLREGNTASVQPFVSRFGFTPKSTGLRRHAFTTG
ncbi:complex I NDUFA9 subunit family protein [Motiliproteus sp.]|uniref:complex I NDUFA9 subunit family protein n=1 Tax=Motiliproteus sp. TaxID=1898955 RepID=UPI003BAD4FEB